MCKRDTGDWCATSKTNNNYCKTWGYCENKDVKPKSPKSPLQRYPSPKSPLQKSPLQKSPLQRSPLQKSPLQKSPLQKSPLQKSPLQKSPLQKKHSSSSSIESPLQPPPKVRSRSSSLDIDKKRDKENFDMILAKVTYEFKKLNIEYKSVTIGKKKDSELWLVVSPGDGVDKEEYKDLKMAYKRYNHDKWYYKRRYDIRGVEGLDDSDLEKKIIEIDSQKNKKTVKKKGSSSSSLNKKENIGKKYFGLINNKIDSKHLDKVFTLTKKNEDLGINMWTIQVSKVKNRYKIYIETSTITEKEEHRVFKPTIYWWNPTANKKQDTNPVLFLQAKINDGYLLSGI